MSSTTKEAGELARQTAEQLASPEGLAASQAAHSTDSIYMEVPVRVQGSRVVTLVHGVTERVDPFDVETSTLIVLPQGAVVKLPAKVTPGQVLVLRNLNTSRQVLCRVVNIKPYANVKGGYVEVEFTRRVLEFWGVSVPSGEHISSGAPRMSSATPNLTAREAPAGARVPAPTPPSIRLGSTSDRPVVGAGELQSVRIPSEPRVRSADPATAPIPAERKEVETISSAPVPAPASEEIPSVAAFSSFDEIPRFSVPSEAANLLSRPVTPAPLIEPREKEQPAYSALPGQQPNSITSVGEAIAPITASAPSNKFSGSFGRAERSAVLSYGQVSPYSVLETGLEQESPTKLVARDRQPHRKLIIASSAVFVLALALVAGITFFRRHSASIPGSTVSSPVANTLSAPPAAAQPPATTDSLASAAQPQVGADLEAQLNTHSQASPPAVFAGQEETEARNGPRDVLKAAGKLRVPKMTPNHLAAENEEPPLVMDAVPSSVTGSQAGSPMAGIVSGASETGVVALPPPMPKAQSPVRVGGQVKLARVLSSVPPVYPTMAKRAGVEGDVTVQVDIDTAGKVVGVKSVSGPALLHQAAMDAVRQWKYEPPTLDGKPMPAQMLVTLKFRLQK